MREKRTKGIRSSKSASILIYIFIVAGLDNGRAAQRYVFVADVSSCPQRKKTSLEFFARGRGGGGG
jgi:hypothetical protein